jgi:hypothetical protein
MIRLFLLLVTDRPKQRLLSESFVVAEDLASTFAQDVPARVSRFSAR